VPLAFLARAVALLPWSSLGRWGALVGAFVGSVLRVRRAQVEAAVERAGVPEAKAVARGMYASLGTALFEFLWMVGRRSSERSNRLSAEPRSTRSDGLPIIRMTERAKEALGANRKEAQASQGIVIATAHTGNWDLVGCAAEDHGIRLAVFTKRLRIGWLDRFWQRERAARGLGLLHGDGALREATLSLRAGVSVAVLIDQAPERRVAVTEAPFLGESAYHDLSPAILAQRSRSTLVLALARRDGDGSHVVDVPLVLEPPPLPSRAWVDHATRSLNAALETFVREHPSQWLWLHRRWKPLPRRVRRQREVAVSPAVC